MVPLKVDISLQRTCTPTGINMSSVSGHSIWIMTPDASAFVFAPGLIEASLHLDPAYMVIGFQYANSLVRPGGHVNKHGASQVIYY